MGRPSEDGAEPHRAMCPHHATRARVRSSRSAFYEPRRSRPEFAGSFERAFVLRGASASPTYAHTGRSGPDLDVDVVEVWIVEIAGVPALPGGQAAYLDRLPVGDHRAEGEHLDESVAQLL